MVCYLSVEGHFAAICDKQVRHTYFWKSGGRDENCVKWMCWIGSFFG